MGRGGGRELRTDRKDGGGGGVNQCIVPCGEFGSPYPGKRPCSVCGIVKVCPNDGMAASAGCFFFVLFFLCAQMLMHAIAHRDHRKSVCTES